MQKGLDVAYCKFDPYIL